MIVKKVDLDDCGFEGVGVLLENRGKRAVLEYKIGKNWGCDGVGNSDGAGWLEGRDLPCMRKCDGMSDF